MSEPDVLSKNVGRNTRLYDRYTSRALDRLETSGPLQAAEKEWYDFFRNSHGAVFDELDNQLSREDLFIDTLYYDFVVDLLITQIEEETGVRVKNREASHNTAALSFDFRSLHDRLLTRDRIQKETTEFLDGIDLCGSTANFLRDLYENIISPDIRRKLGEYYTPRGVAELAVESLDVVDYETETFLDPGCGSGVFLAACIDAKRSQLSDDMDPATQVSTLTETVYGIDLNPVAVKSAKLSYLLSLGHLLESIETVEVPVFLTDALGVTRTDEIRYAGRSADLTVDHLVGNPPWITWGNLSESLRAAWRDSDAEQLDLVPQQGQETRLGHANDDISVPFVWVCLERYLADGGDASFVLKRDITKGPAGRLLRTQQVGTRPVALTHIHDFNRLRPFGDGVDVGSALFVLRADSDPSYPIEVSSWQDRSESPDFSSLDAMSRTLETKTTGMTPVSPDDDSSTWIRTDAEKRAVGECEHEIRHGVKDDAKAVFSIDRRQLEELESDHVYPYLRSKHVVKYGLFGHDLHLVPMKQANEDNEERLKQTCPSTYEYLESNRETLENRSSSWLDAGPFYNLFGLGEYTWSEYKVVWCRLGFKPHFAVVSSVEDEDLGEKTVIPGDHLMFISTDTREEAHFLCALLNSSVYQQSIEEIASTGKSTLSKSLISQLDLPPYRETPKTKRLATLSMEAHEIVPEHTDVSKREYNEQRIPELESVQAEIDGIVEELLSTESVRAGW